MEFKNLWSQIRSKLAVLWPYFTQKSVNVIQKIKGMSMSGILITLGIVAAAVALGVGSQYFFGDDNVIEEGAEKVIEQQVGIDFDLSPKTPEKK